MRITKLLLVIVAATCSSFAADPATPLPSTRHVIHVSVDGLSSGLLRELIERDTTGRFANFKRMFAEGVSTFNARTDYSMTVTLPNHTCMLTGRPAARPDGWDATTYHGYTSNSDPGRDDCLHTKGNSRAGYIASVFDVAHDHGLSTALYASKSKFVIYTQSYDAERGRPDTIGSDNGRDKIDLDIIEQTPAANRQIGSGGMQRQLLSDLARNPARYTFVHYREPDSAGHGRGWGSDLWNDAVHTVDRYLGELLRLVENDPRLQNNTVIILTSDHGGIAGGRGHHEAHRRDDYTIPFIVWGGGVGDSADLYRLNTGTRRDPGDDRPDYTTELQPIRNGDSGNLALKLLGLPPIPGSSINAKQDLRVR